MTATTAREVWTVLVNAEQQHGLYPADRPAPAGWHPAGFSGTEDECIRHVDTRWTDMRPARSSAAGTSPAERPPVTTPQEENPMSIADHPAGAPADAATAVAALDAVGALDVVVTDLSDVVLQGGPPGLAPAAAIARCSPLDLDRLKIPHAGGYEHYLQADPTGTAVPRVFHWVRRTAVAE